MKENKGFTLIELIAVVVIMGILLLIVFPSLSNVIRSNENKKYDTYYDAVQEQLELYARTRRSELGGIEGTGCVDDRNLSGLKQYDYITEFTEEKKVTCKSPNEFSNAELEDLGINSANQYVNIRIENNKGRINVEYSMICVKEGKRKPEYTKLILKTKNCENYVPTVANSLLSALKDNITGENVNIVDSDYYVKGNVLNNYVWYSGKMWRVVKYNTNDRTIKLVTDDNISLVTYNSTSNGNEYINSNIYNWLNNSFLPTIRNREQYLTKVEWNYSNVDSTVSEQITGGNKVESYIGLLNNYEYLQGKDYLNKNKNFWLISTTNDNKAWYVNNSGDIVESSVNEFYGIRPSIVLKSGVTYVYGGNGTEDNPYKLTGDTGANPNTLLNTRFSGEYVMLNGEIYRITSSSAEYTKLILDSTIDVLKDFHYFDTKYSANTHIGEYLTTWIDPINDYLKNGEFCREKIGKEDFQTLECAASDTIGEINVAIPKVGEMFTTESNYEYWTITNSDPSVNSALQIDGTYKDEITEKLYVVTTNGSLDTKTIEQQSYIRPVIVIDNTVIITGGNGTKNSPYIISRNE